MNVLLISTYELGHQPFGLASPAAWLAAAGLDVTCLDLAVEPLDENAIAGAGLIAFYLPMHTATRLAVPLIPRVKATAPEATICCYGLYAPMNEAYLRMLGVDAVLGGEFEEGLVALARSLSESLELGHTTTRDSARDLDKEEEYCSSGSAAILAASGGRDARAPGQATQPSSRRSPVSPLVPISLARQQFLVPDRSSLPPLDGYAYLDLGAGRRRVAGYTEASRGCKHLCRHCPVVPVYGGRFLVVQRDVVLADIRQQVHAGARHITFGDPDFFNGPGHAVAIVRALHEEFPDLTYDVTIKIEHLLQQAQLLPVLRETGCLFVTSAVESIDDRMLEILDKGHTRADFLRAVALLREAGLALSPTFMPFTPWTSLEGYLELLRTLAELDLIEHVAPVQYAIRLLIPAGSKLLELPSVQRLAGPFDQAALAYPWSHPDPRVDALSTAVFQAVQQEQAAGSSRQAIFARVWQLAAEALGGQSGADDSPFLRPQRPASEPIPHLSEPWYC